MKKKFTIKTKFFTDLKKFLVKGNAIELAFAVVVGTAFTKITTSLVTDIIMPPLGLMIGGVNFSELAITLKPAVIEDGVKVAEAVAISYGLLIQAIIEFLIIGFTVFLVLRLIQRLTSIKFLTKEEAKAAALKLEEEKKQAEAKKAAEEEAKKLAEQRAVQALEADIRSEELLKEIVQLLKSTQGAQKQDQQA